VAAIRAAQLGGKVTLVEKSRIGGTCLNVGCIPTKALVKSAELYEQTKKLSKYGVIVSQAELDFQCVMSRKDNVVQTLVRGVESLIRGNGIRLISGTGTILGPQQVKVQTDGQDIVMQPDKIIIATGSLPAEIPGIETDGLKVMTSTEALSLTTLPESMLLIGGGVIGVELAGIFARLGTKVTIVEAMPAILPEEDRELAAQVHKGLENIGVKIWTGGHVKRVVKNGAGAEVNFEFSGNTKTASVEKVIVCVGRKPNTLGLDMERLGLTKPGGPGIKVNKRMETAIPGIYAVGDVTAEYQLAHVAS
jgi:dihydrolipoamide dehydrogenase